MNTCEARRAMHVGSLPYHPHNAMVFQAMINDTMQSIAPLLPDLFRRHRIMFVNGQLDFIIPPPLNEAFLMRLDWSFKKEYDASPKLVYKVDRENDTEVAAFVRSCNRDRFHVIVARLAGHLVPYGQPRVAYDLFRHLVEEVPFA